MQNKQLKITAQFYLWLVNHQKEMLQLKKEARNHNFCSILNWEIADTKSKIKTCKKELDFWGINKAMLNNI